MGRKVLIGFIVAFVVLEILSYIVNGLILMSQYEALKDVWRQDMDSKMYIFHLTNLVFAFMFAFIFSKGYEGKGIGEGVRYGFYIGVMVWIPAAYNTYASFALPYGLIWKWWVLGIIQTVIAGIAVAAVFGRGGGKAPA